MTHRNITTRNIVTRLRKHMAITTPNDCAETDLQIIEHLTIKPVIAGIITKSEYLFLVDFYLARTEIISQDVRV